MDQSATSALDALRRADPERAEAARAAWESLTSGAGPEVVTQWRVQLFCWRELARSWLIDGAAKWRVAASLAELLDGLGLHRYAEIARGETTRQLLAASTDDSPSGRAAYEAAFERALEISGIAPPNTSVLSWATLLGPAEADAIDYVASRLELAVAAGDLVPGARGWRAHQSALTEAVLTTPQLDQRGAILLDGIVDERLIDWYQSGSGARTRLLEPVAVSLRTPIDPPPPELAAVELRPLWWLLDVVGDGLTLTSAGYLPPAVITRALDELDWRDQEFATATREVDALPVSVLREFAREMGLVRRRAGRLLLTRSGQEAAADPVRLWTELAARLVPAQQTARAAATEILLAALSRGGEHDESELMALLGGVLAEEGWRAEDSRGTASRLPRRMVLELMYDVLRPLTWSGLVEATGSWDERGYVVGPAASALFRAALRHRVVHGDRA